MVALQIYGGDATRKALILSWKLRCPPLKPANIFSACSRGIQALLFYHVAVCAHGTAYPLIPAPLKEEGPC